MDPLELFELKIGGNPSVFVIGREEALEEAKRLEELYPYSGIPFMLKCPTELLRASEGHIQIPERDLRLLLEIINKRLTEVK